MTDNILPAPLNSNKKSTNNTGGRPKKPIWRFFEQGDEIDKGHYIATCLACKQSFRPGKATTMEKHIISNCSQVNHSVRKAVMYMIEAREVREVREISSNKRKIEKDQTTLENFYENSDLSKERKEDIDIALIKAFVCCGLPWCLVEHPFIIELFKQLRSNYNLTDRKILADSILTKEILRVNVKLYRLLDGENNLTLGKIYKEFINFLKIKI